MRKYPPMFNMTVIVNSNKKFPLNLNKSNLQSDLVCS